MFHTPTKQRGIVISLSQYFSRKKWEAKLKKKNIAAALWEDSVGTEGENLVRKIGHG
jgi:hypothetical protein